MENKFALNRSLDIQDIPAQPELQWSKISSPFGPAIIWFDNKRLYRLDIAPRGDLPARRQREVVANQTSKHPWSQPAPDSAYSTVLPDFLTDLFTGSATLPVGLWGSDGQRQVWRALTTIPLGTTITYGQLANKVFGSTNYARAVGAMVGQNPVAWFIPCHRVVAASGALNGFGCGLTVKREMLELEQALPQQQLDAIAS